MSRILAISTLTLPQLKFRLVLGVVALNLIGTGLTTYSLWRDREQYDQRVAVATQNLAQLVENDVDALFSRVDMTLHQMVEDIDQHVGQGRANADQVNAYLRRDQNHIADIVSLRMTDSHGRVMYGNDVTPGTVDLSDRDFFRQHRDNADLGVVISKPVQARISKVWSIAVARRLNRPDGAFAGILYANLPVDYLTRKFSKIELGVHGVVALRNLDFELLARYPAATGNEAAMGQPAASTELARMLAAGMGRGTFSAKGPTDQIERTITFHRLNTYPLYVVVGQAPRDYLGAWWRNVAETVALNVVMFSLTIIMAVLIFRGWRRQLSMGEAVRESEERLSLALESGEFCVWDWELATGKVVFSKRGKQLFGYADDEIGNEIADWEVLVHPQDQERVPERLRQVLKGGIVAGDSIEYRILHRDGHWMWILTRGMVTRRDAQGRALRLVGTHVDVTTRRQREEDLRMAATVLQIADEAVIVSDADNLIVSVNPAFTIITGYEAHEVVGRNPSLLSAKTHPPAFYQAMWDSLKATGTWRGEVLNRKKNGAVYIEWLTIKRIADATGLPAHYVAVFSDITERKASEKRMQHLALHDALTQLPNRTLLTERIEQAIVRARRDKSRVGLMYFDLDTFKPINDSLGHEVGDLLLKAVAQRVVDCVRESDTVARVGGDEFVVLFPAPTEEKDVMRVAEKIRAALNQPFQVAGNTLNISTSIGLAIYPEHGDGEQTLTRNADAAMYLAKTQGRNRVVVYQPGM